MNIYLSLLLCAFLSLSSYGADRGPDADGAPPAKRLKREGEGKGDGDADHASFTTGLTTIVLPMELFDSLKQPERVGTVIATETLEPGYETKLRQLYPNLTSIIQAKTLVLPRDDLNRMMTNPGPSEHSGPDAERVTTVIIWPCDHDTPIDTAQALGALRGIFPHIMEVVAGQTFTLTPQILTAFTQGVPNARALLVHPDRVTELVLNNDVDYMLQFNIRGFERIMGQFPNLTSLCLDEIFDLPDNAPALANALESYQRTKGRPLTELQISNNMGGLEDKPLPEALDAFTIILRAVPHLSVLVLSNCINDAVLFSMPDTFLGLPCTQSLRSLGLKNNFLALGPHGLFFLNRLLARLPNIRHLDISGNTLNERGLWELFHFLHQNQRTLDSLDVGAITMTDESAFLRDHLTELKQTRSALATPLVRNLFVSPDTSLLFLQIMMNFCGANTLVAINVKPY